MCVCAAIVLIFIALRACSAVVRIFRAFPVTIVVLVQVALYCTVFSVTVNNKLNIEIVGLLATHHFHSVLRSTNGLTCLVCPRLSPMSHPTRRRCFMLTNPDRFTICYATPCIFSAHTATLTFPAIIVSVASNKKKTLNGPLPNIGNLADNSSLLSHICIFSSHISRHQFFFGTTETRDRADVPPVLIASRDSG